MIATMTTLSMNEIQEWEVWRAKVRYEDDPKKSKKRPVLVIPSERNSYDGIACLKITSQGKKIEIDYTIPNWKELGLTEGSTILIGREPLWIPRKDLIKRLCKLPPHGIFAVELLSSIYYQRVGLISTAELTNKIEGVSKTIQHMIEETDHEINMIGPHTMDVTRMSNIEAKLKQYLSDLMRARGDIRSAVYKDVTRITNELISRTEDVLEDMDKEINILDPGTNMPRISELKRYLGANRKDRNGVQRAIMELRKAVHRNLDRDPTDTPQTNGSQKT